MSSRWATLVILVLAFAPALAGWAVLRGQTGPEPVAPSSDYLFAGMVRAADSLPAVLEPEQRSKALFEFEDSKRLDWHFGPRACWAGITVTPRTRTDRGRTTSV